MTAPAPDQDQGVDPATGQISPAVLDAVIDQTDQRRADRAAEAEQRKATAEGPCSRCGASASWLRPGKGGWYHDAMGAICARCDAERRDFGKPEDADRPRGRPDGPILPDSEHRAKVIARLVGPDEARWQWGPFLVDRSPELLPWYCETPGARPWPGVEGFAYVDVPALVDKLHAKPPPPPELVRWQKCPRCKRRDRWQVTERPVSGQAYTIGHKVTPGYIEVRRICHGQDGRCRYEPEPERRYT